MTLRRGQVYTLRLAAVPAVESGEDRVAVSVEACGESVEARQVVLLDGVEPLREPFALALGEHLGEGPDVTGQGVEFRAVGQDGLEPELFDLGQRLGSAEDPLIGVVFGPTADGETSCASRLLRLLRPDMLVLWDKGFDGNGFLAAVTAIRAQFLGRLRSNRRTPGPHTSRRRLVPVGDRRREGTCDRREHRGDLRGRHVFTGSYRLATT
ncbi:hypothetical protein [Streptomyces enissocaesilis]|uniref:Transposase IS4-like domain-containing protein n=1 Tax=Streptomyces enissocaesilis TaxID=332589 RepID=A0ABP6J6H9_9ACTN